MSEQLGLPLGAVRRSKKRKEKPIIILGHVALVELTMGYFSAIDAADVPLVAKHSWCISRCGKMTNGRPKKVRRLYAKCMINGRRVLMHRFLARTLIDHRNGNGLDNRRSNLRPAADHQNRVNKRYRTNTSGFHGVRFDRGAWVSRVSYQKKHWSRRFRTLEEAVRARDAKALELHGEFAVLNGSAAPCELRQRPDSALRPSGDEKEALR